MNNPTSDLQTLWSLIKDIKFGMLTHRHSDGSLQGHPLTTQNKSLDEGSVLYFFISQKSEMATRRREDSKMTQLFKMGRAAVSGEQPSGMHEHKELRVS